MKSICVFCGSSSGNHPEYLEAAKQFGHLMAEQGLTLYYGGAKIGLMGAIADACLQAGGAVVGVLPHFIQKHEIAHHGLTELVMVDTMFERKRILMERADAFVALPGGLGTLDELFEVWTFAQLTQLGPKPIGLLNTRGFYEGLLAQAKHAVAEGFMRQTILDYLRVESTPEQLLKRLQGPLPKLDSLKDKVNHR